MYYHAFRIVEYLFEIWNWLYGVPRNYGKVSGDEEWDWEAVAWIILSGPNPETAAVHS